LKRTVSFLYRISIQRKEIAIYLTEPKISFVVIAAIKVTMYYTGGLSGVKALRWSSDGNMLAAVGMDNAVKVFHKQ
jgi:hypothetical protein